MNNQEKNTITDNRIKISDSYVFYKAEDEFRNEFFLALRTKGLTFQRFADAFSEYLDKLSREYTNANKSTSIKKAFCKTLKKKGREELSNHGTFDWESRYKKFSSREIIGLNYGEVMLIKKFLSEFPDK